LKIALVHDWLTGMRGGEKVLEQLCGIFPQADIYTLICDRNKISDKIKKHRIKTSFLQLFPGIMKSYRNFLPLFPAAIESFNLKKYDLVVSSSHCVAKGVKTGKKTIHVCYCHTPMRYAWDQFDNYFSPEKNGKLKFFIISRLMEGLRKWDVETVSRVDFYIANSEHVKKRIQKHYNREAVVINPPVDTDFYFFDDTPVKEDVFLMVSALTEYKKVDFVIDVFNGLNDKNLAIIGAGPMLAKLKKSVKRDNIKMLGSVDDETVREYYRKSKAFIFPGEEDFGITMGEAQACGLPVLAYNKGGALEIIIDGETGEFFNGTKEDFIKKLEKIENTLYDSKKVAENGKRFAEPVFREKITAFLKERELYE